jgi:hypothetical protein
MLIIIFLVNSLFGNNRNPEDSCKILSVKPIEDLSITATTGEKPQSKVWFHNKSCWAVLPDKNGTELWQLLNNRWESVLHLSDAPAPARLYRVVYNS